MPSINLATEPQHVVDNLLMLHSYARGSKEERSFHFDRIYNAEHQVYYQTSEGPVFAPVKWCGARDNNIDEYWTNKDPISQVFQRNLTRLGYRQLTVRDQGYEDVYARFLKFCRGFGFKSSAAGLPHSNSRPRTFWAQAFSRNLAVVFPDEVSSEGFREGATKQVTVNAFERNPAARLACIAHYGWACQACGFNFEQRFGSLGSEFIHVHHVALISAAEEEYEVDPVEDLRPVCPNCHAMIHRRNPPLTVEELAAVLKAAGSKAGLS